MKPLSIRSDLTSRRSATPLFETVRNLLKGRLEAGEWAVGDKFPTIENLMNEFGVSRITIRAAQERLEREGLIRRERGSGTTVTKVPATQHWLLLPNDWKSLVRHIESLRTRTEDINFVKAPAPLGPDDGVPASEYWQARRANHLPSGQCYSLTRLWLDRSIFDRTPDRFRATPVLPALLQMSPDVVATAWQRLTITTADLDAASLLDLEIGAPIARIHRFLCDGEGRAIYVADALYPAKHMAIETDLLGARTPRGDRSSLADGSAA